MTTKSYILSLRQVFGTGLLIIPSVAAIILNSQGKILLQKKSNECWSLPAGSIELGETPREAIIREVREETGYNVIVKKIIDVFGGKEFRYVYPNNHQVEYVVTLFHCEVISSNSKFTDLETKHIKYFSESNMPKLALPYPVEALFLRGQYKVD